MLAVLARGLPGLNMDQHLAFPQGETVRIPDTSMYLKNEKFTVEFYSEEEMPEEFRGKKTLLSFTRRRRFYMNARQTAAILPRSLSLRKLPGITFR